MLFNASNVLIKKCFIFQESHKIVKSLTQKQMSQWFSSAILSSLKPIIFIEQPSSKKIFPIEFSFKDVLIRCQPILW